MFSNRSCSIETRRARPDLEAIWVPEEQAQDVTESVANPSVAFARVGVAGVSAPASLEHHGRAEPLDHRTTSRRISEDDDAERSG